MFVFVSHLTVPADDHAALEKHFRERSHLVENCPGFLYLQLLRPQAGGATHTFLTAWKDKEAFRLYMASEERARSQRAKCVQDMRYNVEHLAPAVALEDPSMFAGYARWLASLLTARGIPAGEIERSIALTRTEIRSRFPADEAAAALPALDAALAALATTTAARP